MFSDSNSLKYFLSLQDQLQPTMAIEVGAYDADFAKLVVQRGIPTYAFEGSPSVYEQFKGDMGKISYIHNAITNYEGNVIFNIENKKEAHNMGHNGIKKTDMGTIEEYIEVPCTSLDIYFKDIQNQKIALWIDCEGANQEVLEGSCNILSMVDSIFIEVEHKQLWKDIWIREDVINYLESFGFKLIKEFPAYPNQTNCIFTR